MVICQGCGQGFDVPEGYGRNKIQCPGCGVICPVAADRPRLSPAPANARRPPAPTPGASEDEAANWLLESGPSVAAPTPYQEPAAKRPREEPAARQPPEKLFPCRRCGRQIRKQRECPSCDRSPEPQMGSAIPAMELDEPPPAIEAEEDDSPYVLAEKLPPTCPKCRKEMTPGAVLCTACGFNMRTRKKAGRAYEPLVRTWVTDLSLAGRLAWLGGVQLTLLVLAALAAARGIDARPFLVSLLPVTAILCFVVGTYERITITRDVRGRVMLVLAWRFCFVPIKPHEREVVGFEGVTTGMWHDSRFWDWFVLLTLLPLLVVPSIVWWYYAIYKPHFHVALTQDQGRPEVYVYRGRSLEQMNDIATTLCNLARLQNVG